ncbi:MAG: GNAT family N-acetyltransferase [Acidobacteriota bacterium]|nr:GNAT family N-acetyltransferase [Acidobacteriota bacterium]
MAIEIIDIRHFRAQDFEPLLAAESKAWFSDLRWDYSPSIRLISACLADKRLSGYALLSGGQIYGYSFFLYEGDKGIIGDLFVLRDGEKRRNALVLLEHVIETLKATPGADRVEAQLPHFALEELEGCFRRNQFDAYLRRFMAADLAARADSGSSADFDRDFVLETWQRKHDDAAARLLFHTYRAHVDAAINDQYRTIAGTSHLIENIVHLKGCGEIIPPASFVALHRSTRKMAGIIALTAVRPGTAHIPQVAVDSEFQGRGAGLALIEAGFQAAQKIGFREVTLTVTDANAGAVRFYERLGFETFRTFGAFVWKKDR